MDFVNKNGLSTKTVNDRLLANGFNELPSQKKKGLIRLVLSVLSEPMLLLLVITGVIYLLIGSRNDALMLLGGALVIVFITIVQERKTENALEELKKLSNPRTYVIRNGVRQRIFSREIVVGDLIELREGDRVPADAIVTDQTNLTVDESILTGESVQVRKTASTELKEITKPGGDDLPFVYSGTLVTQGRGHAVVLKTGVKTEIGKIGVSLSEIREESTLLKKETAKLVRTFAFVGLSLCIALALVIGLTKNDWTGALLSGLTLGMSMIPEEFSVILLVFLTLGSLRLSRRKVLTRHSAAIETLGATSVLCVDKTGTLTLNKMRLVGLMANGEFILLKNSRNVLNESFHKLLEYSVLASHNDKFDPIEKEIFSRGIKLFGSHDHIHETWKLIREYPISSKLLAISHVWKSRASDNFIVATKGAPETIIELCHVSATKKAALLSLISEMSSNGLRVIGVAKAEFKGDDLPDKQHDYNFEFVGFLGFVDPIKKSIKQSVSECHRASVRVVMITGDYPGTAKFIAKQIGLKNPDEYIDGSELERMDKRSLCERIKTVNVFARVVPAQKLIIVNALKANGDIVAMTGDGVNDAPALKSAQVGIAMGKRGTDVAREASDIVLLNDDFNSIVHGVKLGRRIFDNLRKSMSFIFSIHFPIAGIALLPALLNLPPVLFPAHIAFLELIIDPACSTVFESEKEEPYIMERPPRDLKKPLFDKKTSVLSMLQGLSLFAVVLLVYLISINTGMSEDTVRSTTFITIVFGNLMLIITNLSYTQHFVSILANKNKTLYIILFGTVAGLFFIFTIPGLRNLFHFGEIGFSNVLIAFGMSALSVAWFEGFKILKQTK